MAKTPRFDTFQPASPTSSHIKQANRREGGAAERLLRATLWKRGLRYQKQVSDLPGKPDIVFRGAKLCVFVDGDFWHGRDWPQLQVRLTNRANPTYWIPKIARNRERDIEQTNSLRAAGWKVLRIWETEVLRDPVIAADQVERQLSEPFPTRASQDTSAEESHIE